MQIKQKSHFKLSGAQLELVVILIISVGLWGLNLGPSHKEIGFFSVSLLVGVWGLFAKTYAASRPGWQLTAEISRALMGFFVPALLISCIGALASVMPVLSNRNGVVSEVIIFGAFVLSLWPLLVNILQPIETTAIRMVALFAFLMDLSFAVVEQLLLMGWHLENNYLADFAYYGFYFIAIMGIMHRWGYRLPQLRFNSKIHYGGLVVLLVPPLLDLGITAGSWQNLFTKFDLQLASTSIWYIVGTIFLVCFKEEFIFRYLFLWPLMNYRGSTRTRTFRAVLISSIFFGLWHLQNLYGQTLIMTLLQVLFAFTFGMVVAVIAMYTGTIWIGIILHSLIDLVGFPQVDSPFSQSLSPFFVEALLLTSAIELAVALWFLLHKRFQPAFEQTLAHFERGLSL